MNPPNLQQTAQPLLIEKMIYGGDGLARLPPEPGDPRPGKAVFVPFVLPGEQVSATIIGQKQGFARARATAINLASPQRVVPPCPYFQACGGCHYQHTTYENQLAIKKNILLETLHRTARLDWTGPVVTHPSPEFNYRNRSRLQVRASGGFTLGYFRFGSKEVLPVEVCPISSAAINRGIAAVWSAGRAGKIAAAVREIEFFATTDDSAMLLQVYVAEDSVDEDFARNIAEMLSEAVPEIVGVIFCNRRSAGEKPGIDREYGWTQLGVAGEDHLTYATTFGEYRVSGGAFFQVNRHLIDELAGSVMSGAEGQLALDLYAGVGLFSKALAQRFARVIAVENSPASFADLRHNFPAHANTLQSTTETFLRSFTSRMKSGKQPRADFLVVDPPRAGLGDKVVRLIRGLNVPVVSYISCDPSTLSRDLRGLLESGYCVEEIHLFDLFPQTFHIESMVRLRRQ